jgi:KDO2-lipid IV(A) lauroyltransferase
VIHNPSRLRRALWKIGEVGMIGVVRGVFALARALGPDRSSAVGGAIARRLGPLLPQHRIGLENLRAAFPDRSEAEIRAILAGAWENIGRLGAEYPHLGQLFDYDHYSGEIGRIEVDGIEHFIALAEDGGLEAARQGAAFAMRGVLERGGHLGMLIDQHFTRGVTVDFLGRPAFTNPIMGKFARAFDCPVHGVRVIRLAAGRFRLQLTPALELPRDAEGLVDVQGAMQAMTRVVEGWVREHPEQWLWMHRRWRPPLPHARLKAT